MSTTTSLEQIAQTFTGQLLQQADPGYDQARRVHNGLIDKRPALIARCQGAADVADAVALARSLNLEVAVRGGGHNVAGRATVDGGLMIDLAAMKGIHVDPAARTVRAQGGVLWKELNRETQVHGLATTGGVVSSTGIARPDAGRRPRLADAEIRPRARQPPLRRAGPGRRPHRARERARRTPICSGPSAAAAATSASPCRSSTTSIRSAR